MMIKILHLTFIFDETTESNYFIKWYFLPNHRDASKKPNIS